MRGRVEDRRWKCWRRRRGWRSRSSRRGSTGRSVRDALSVASAHILAGIEHGPATPWLLSGVGQPCRQVRIAYDQRQNGRSQRRGIRGGKQACCYEEGGQDAQGRHRGYGGVSLPSSPHLQEVVHLEVIYLCGEEGAGNDRLLRDHLVSNRLTSTSFSFSFSHPTLIVVIEVLSVEASMCLIRLTARHSHERSRRVLMLLSSRIHIASMASFGTWPGPVVRRYRFHCIYFRTLCSLSFAPLPAMALGKAALLCAPKG